jgi:S-methylmethionine-dependent homocysteine/selenocysteine methylase
MEDFLKSHPLIIMEAGVVERLRRDDSIELHPTLVNAPLIYEASGRKKMAEIYLSYLNVAVESDLPFVMVSPTWRTNKERVDASGINKNINQDVIAFMKEIRDQHRTNKENIKIGGMIGCKNDCYLPEEGLTTEEAIDFHAWQIEQLVKGGVDFIIAETLPNVNEALGIALACEQHDLPYVISFVISRDGKVLDGTSLEKAMKFIDDHTKKGPIGYSINCAYPTFLCAKDQPVQVLEKLIGYFGNASSLDHCDLEQADVLYQDSVSDWGNEMLKLNRKYGIKILGGCCGTEEEHLQYLINN